MSNYQKLEAVLEFVSENLSGKAGDLAVSFKAYYKQHGQLTDKQLYTLESLCKQLATQMESVTKFESLLGSFFKGNGAKIFKLCA